MSYLITLENVSLAYGLNPLLENVKFQISTGERVCLIGRNGAGKSSMMKLIDGTLQPDSGSVLRKPGLRLARLEQELPQDVHISVYEYVARGLAEAGDLLAAYHAVTQRMVDSCTDSDLEEMQRLQQKIDAINGWQFEQNIKTILTRLELDAEQLVSSLSGGWQRRASLAKALVSSPELLLLDEPTNHLDVAAIQWLEDQLLSLGIGLLFITHDRALLQRLATRIIELDRGQLTSWPGDYANFLRRKEEMLHAEEKQNAEFDKKLAQEERWIRQGIKARRTRNEGRVRALEAMRRTRAERRNVQGKASFNTNEAVKSGQLVVEATNVSQAFNGKIIMQDFSMRIMRGDKIALIGPNGVGKSTLLNVLLGQLTPDSGDVVLGTKLQVAYFDQLRQALDLNKTVVDNVIEGSDIIETGTERKHIMSYLGDFLFTPERARTPVKALSGGECNRLLLAKLFSKPANLLVLDEPTNDLDIETLELLEELLAQYQGTLLLVSHDRTFVDNVVTGTLVFEGEGKITEYVGGYQDYLKQRKEAVTKPTAVKASVPESKPVEAAIASKNKKLSYKEQRELAELPGLIEKLEQEQFDIQESIADPMFYKSEPDKVAKTLDRLKIVEADLEKAFARWSELE